MRFKNIVSMALAMTMIVPSQIVFAQDNNIKVFVNDSQLEFDTQPTIINGRVMVPFRKIFEELDCAVSFDSYGVAKSVNATKGEEYISADIGSNVMYANGEEIKLDSPVIIENGRTLVPLRAVSESLDCSVDWNNDNRVVTISKKQGLYNIKTVSKDVTLTDDDNTPLIYIAVSYPVIGDNSDFAKKINDEYKNDAEKYIEDIKTTYMDSGEAKDSREAMGENFYPMTFTNSYEVNTNRKGYVSITNCVYENTNGAHPNSYKSSRTFDLNNSKELNLKEVLGIDDEGLETTLYDMFLAILENEIEGFNNDDASNIINNLDKVNWYITDSKIVIYFNPYDVAPYYVGSPTQELDLDNPYITMQLDILDGDLDNLNVEIDTLANDTWKVTEYDDSKIKLADKNENTDTSKDYTYNAVISGVGEGITDVAFECDSNADVVKTVKYKLYVSKDKKITVLDESVTEK